ncbi:MAG TPA: hypothetical protein VMK16_14345 [Acidimicrobiales bacterium]|nr:hypothetical protein [Acidimicrobiales bacterium]
MAADLDAMLERLTAAADTVGANLLELERDANYELLQHMTLRGATLERWQAAEAAVVRLWSWFGALRGVLDEATGAKSERALRGLLTAASVRVAAPDVPLRDRDLLEPASRLESCTPDEAIAIMQRDFDAVRLVVGAVGLTWDVTLPRLRATEATLDEVTAAAADLGADGLPPVRLREDIAALAEALTTDPLSVSPEAVEALTERVAAAEAKVAKAVALRDNVTEVLAEARSLARRVEDNVLAARAARAEVNAKVADADVPGLPDDLDGLSTIEQLVERKRWIDAQSQLTAWTTTATARLVELGRLTAAIRLPLEQRNELRGRLEAYHAKAGRLGRSEDAALDALYQAARAELYVAPTDLERAADLVTSYADAIPAEQRKRPVGRSG